MKPFDNMMIFDSKVMINRAVDALQNITTYGLGKTMNKFNA